jgi:hypothetical protein
MRSKRAGHLGQNGPCTLTRWLSATIFACVRVVGQPACGLIRVICDGPFPWENLFGFHLAGMVGHDFFKPYAVTFDFQNMQIFLQ